MEAEQTRAMFEERAYANYYLSTIKKNPNIPQPRISGALDFVSIGAVDKVEFVKRDPDGNYVRPELNTMWFGWCMHVMLPYASRKAELLVEARQVCLRLFEVVPHFDQQARELAVTVHRSLLDLLTKLDPRGVEKDPIRDIVFSLVEKPAAPEAQMAYREFHRLWTACVGSSDYVKSDWQSVEKQLRAVGVISDESQE